MTDDAKPRTSVQSMNSVLSTLRVLEEVAIRQPIGVSELARATRIPKSTVQRCLVTLQQAGWLRIVDPDLSRWGVTMKVLAIGLRGAGKQDLQVLAAPVLKRLAAETDETVHLALRDGHDCIIVGREDTTQIIRVFLELGTRLPLRATSAGVAIMACLESEEIDEILGDEPTEYDDLSPAELRQEIERTAERGYSVNMSAWYRPHVSSIGAVIKDSSKQPVAALALSIPQMRFDPAREDALARLTVAAADEITTLISAC